MSNDQVAAHQQCDDHRDAQDELQRWPKHSHQLNQPLSTRDVLAVELFEQGHLRFFAAECADKTRARVILLRLRGDLGETCLNTLEAIVNSASKVLDQDASERHGRESHKGKIRAESKQKEQSEHREENSVGAVHEGRTKQHANGIQVIGHAGHNIAGAVALIEARILTFEMSKEIVADVEFDFPRDPDEDPALGVQENALRQRDDNQ